MIAEMTLAGHILPSAPFADDQVQPASLDLRLGPIAYRVRASFLPGPGSTVERRIKDLQLHIITLNDGAVLETGCVYIVPLMESLSLPSDISATANPKSSTGRIDVFTRVIADHSRGFDQVAPGLSGPALCGDFAAHLSGAGAARLAAVANPLPARRYAARCRRNCRRCTTASGWSMPTMPISTMALRSVSICPGDFASGLIGYRAKRHTGAGRCRFPQRLQRRRFLGADERARDGSLILDPERILHPRLERVRAGAADYAAEMVPFDPLVGEFCVHYAGFFDPGFGYAGAGGQRLPRRAGGALARGAVHSRTRPDRRPAGLTRK